MKHGPEAQIEEVPSRTKYVCGFLFDGVAETVLLIDKLRPEWQRGKMNGIGGKIEKDETHFDAMRREFAEEAGVDVRGWMLFHKERFNSGVTVYYFAALDSSAMQEAHSMTDEALLRIDLRNGMPKDVIYNLPYLIPMARILAREHVANVPVVA